MAYDNVIEDGTKRVREALESLEDEAKRVQKELKARRTKLEKRFEKQRKDIEKRFATQRKQIEKRVESRRKDLEKRGQKFRKELEKNATFKRLDGLRKDATKQIEQNVSGLLENLNIATKGDVQRIDRKISQLNRKLREMDQA